MSIDKIFKPAEAESHWYEHWEKQGYFQSKIKEGVKPYTVVIPPPNVTGVLHMGHMLNNTIQDVLVRKKRMEGLPTCWVPGTDHASIATEAKVVAMLKEKGIDKHDVGREKFLEYAYEWKDKYGGIILKQLRKIGASCDWSRTTFTMDPAYYKAVIDVFVDLYRKGLIYRGVRMVNWDPQGLTAISDDEVIYKEVQSKLYYVRYPLVNGNGYITVATTRPETILGDTAVCVHPKDERYKSLIGQKVRVPVANREVPIIADDYIDPEFGTGVLKVTPAHDINDYEIGLRHGLPSIDTLNPNGTLSEAAGHYVGRDRFDVRKQIAKDLEVLGLLEKVEEIKNKVGTSERTGAVIEPKLSLQWFVKIRTLSDPALQMVLDEEVKLIPDKYLNTYRHWMENVKDWCISRQLWWGQRIPAFYAPDGSMQVAATKEEAAQLFLNEGKDFSVEAIIQDEDVLDTWFSSWLWPMAVFDTEIFSQPEGKRKPNDELSYYYPTDDLVTAPEILFFWVARMIMAGKEYMGQRPFKNVYLHGIVRDKQGRKMSKSLGNSPDPLDLINQYGADGVRVGMLLSAPAGNDLLFDEKLCEQGRNFYNKLWNAFRLIKGWEVDASLAIAQPKACDWFENRFQEQLAIIEDHFSKYRISDALMSVYKLIYDDFCAWYLEMIKPEYGKPIDPATLQRTIGFFENILKVLHPFMPFVSEELWHELAEREEGDDLIIAPWPKIIGWNQEILDQTALILELVNQIRGIRNQQQLSPKESIELIIITSKESGYNPFEGILSKLVNISSISYNKPKPEFSASLVLKGDEFIIPLGDQFDPEQEKEKLDKELVYTRGFLESVLKKLGNEKFVQHAKPEVIENELRKKLDAESKIQLLELQIAALSKALN